ncbi:PRTRC system ThiF family protein [Pedobacter sp. KLB.chiD]|uniref:PRTRC system ThiF family protein n=1 Tax=Pedobacter sp. KLB.chiD TaxID=3387402 RepID=UPI00399BDA7E
MNGIKKRVHIVYPYLLNPTNPISVNLIGAGGSGSQMLTALARINHALNMLGHAGLNVYVFDHDTVQRANLARQLFTENEIGLNKGVALINRVNRFFGTDWKAMPYRYNTSTAKKRLANITVSCVDTIGARIEIEESLHSGKEHHIDRDSAIYLLDLGNGRDSGQAVLSTVGEIKQAKSLTFETVEMLPSMVNEYKAMLENGEELDNQPSCSLAEALGKQDLFINSALVNMAASLLWQMLRVGIIENRGFFLSLGGFRSQPIAV